VGKELLRKSFHLAYGMVLASAVFLLPKTLAIVFLTTVLVIGGALSINYKGLPFFQPLLDLMEREGAPAGKGALAFTFGALGATVLFERGPACWGILFLAFGDAFATIVGLLVKGPKIPGQNGKTWAGLTACVIANFSIGIVFSPFSLTRVLIASVAVALTEAFLPNSIDDNVAIPVVAGAVFGLF
jgi:dolichol kinase